MLCIRFGHCIADRPREWAEEADEFSLPLVTCRHTHIIFLISSHYQSFSYISTHFKIHIFTLPQTQSRAVFACISCEYEAAGIGCVACDAYLVASRKMLAYICRLFVPSYFRMAITLRKATDLSPALT